MSDTPTFFFSRADGSLLICGPHGETWLSPTRVQQLRDCIDVPPKLGRLERFEVTTKAGGTCDR